MTNMKRDNLWKEFHMAFVVGEIYDADRILFEWLFKKIKDSYRIGFDAGCKDTEVKNDRREMLEWAEEREDWVGRRNT